MNQPSNPENSLINQRPAHDSPVSSDARADCFTSNPAPCVSSPQPIVPRSDTCQSPQSSPLSGAGLGFTLTEKEALDIAWKYFQQHASQRISFFNFYIVVASCMLTGLVTTFGSQFLAHHVGIAIGLMLAMTSFIFFKIDERNKFLTKKGEEALKEIESHYSFLGTSGSSPSPLQIFRREEAHSRELKEEYKEKGTWVVLQQISHSKCFNILLEIYGLAGFFGALVSGVLLFQSPTDSPRVSSQVIQTNVVLLMPTAASTNQAMPQLNAQAVMQVIAVPTNNVRRSSPVAGGQAKINRFGGKTP